VDRAYPPFVQFTCPIKQFNATAVSYIDGPNGEQHKGLTGDSQNRWGIVWCHRIQSFLVLLLFGHLAVYLPLTEVAVFVVCIRNMRNKCSLFNDFINSRWKSLAMMYTRNIMNAATSKGILVSIVIPSVVLPQLCIAGVQERQQG
jgi:hypothetical protein